MDASGAPAGWGCLARSTGRGWGSRLERCSCLYRFINFEAHVVSGLAPVAHVNNGLSGSQARNGACRSEGLEGLVAGQQYQIASVSLRPSSICASFAAVGD